MVGELIQHRETNLYISLKMLLAACAWRQIVLCRQACALCLPPTTRRHVLCKQRAHMRIRSRWSVGAYSIHHPMLSSPLISTSLVLIITVRDVRGDELNAHASLSVLLIRLHRVPGPAFPFPSL